MGRKGSVISRKGAFELSVGFIVIIIIAVVLLTLGVTWLNQIFPQITGMTNDLFQKGSDSLQKTFQQSSQSFAIYPSQYDLGRGQSLRMAAGVRNNAPDSLDHNFVINVVPAAVSSDVLRNYGCTTLDGCTSINIDGRSTSLKAFMGSWAAWTSTPFIVKKTESLIMPVTIKVPTSAPAGTYQFGFVACKSTSSTDSGSDVVSSFDLCRPTSTSVWGSGVQTVDILVKI